MTSTRFAVFACLASPLAAQWLAHSPPNSPAPVSGHHMAYALAQAECVLFGGFRGSSVIGETWTYDGTDWTLRTPPLSPPPRMGGRMAADALRSVVVLYGGSPNPFGIPTLDDTWEWNGSTWRQATPRNTPRGRFGHAMAYDLLRGRTVLWGGGVGAGGTPGTTWQYDGTDWTVAATSAAPNALTDCAMAYDVGRNRTFVFGGRDANLVERDELWAWDGATWSLVPTVTRPPARLGAGLTYDWHSGALVLFGGGYGLLQVRDDTWTFDGVDWRRRDGAGSRPTGRFRCALAYDVLRANVVIVGDAASEPETWHYGAGTAPFGEGCPGSGGIPAWDVPPPTLGAPLQATLQNLGPAVTGAGALVSFRAVAPVALDTLGLPGCRAYVSIDRFAPMQHTGSSATLTLPIPNDPGLRGASFYLTGMAFEPANAFGAVLSAPVRCLLAL
ncbi:MAG: hypothetical protein AB7O97_06885 [Planctomycetota bacterium]